MEAYNGGVLFGNSPGATAQEIAILGMNVETKGEVEKAQILARGKYTETAFLLSLYRLRHGEMILSQKNDDAKKQRNYPKTLLYMYGLMLAFNITRQHRCPRGATKV